MEARLDQVIFGLEAGRVVVRVEYFDALGKLRRETFHRPTAEFALALEEVARILAGRGVRGPGRVRHQQGNRLRVVPELQKRFLQTLRNRV